MHSIEVIEKNLLKLQKLNYNQFFWWRRWTRKGKSLHKYSPLIDKIQNGDYDDSPYRWQIYYCDWEIEQKRTDFPDVNEWAHETTIDRNRRRRWREDHEPTHLHQENQYVFVLFPNRNNKFASGMGYHHSHRFEFYQLKVNIYVKIFLYESNGATRKIDCI
jgi:hypothetical protein